MMSLPLLLTGCGGDGFTVTGKVTFPDDSPLDYGSVVFESGSHAFYGGVNPDGSYTMMGGTGNKKIPSGTYKVYLMGTVRSGNPNAAPIPTDADGNQIGPPPKEVPDIQLVAKKYLQRETSDLQCEVSKNTKFDIPVEKP
jgi:hypothetical protein